MKLLLIGAGQLGSRHLQACLKYPESLDIYVVDSSRDSLEISRSRANEIDTVDSHKVYYYENLSQIEAKEIDFLIIATGASVRYEILKNVLQLFIVKNAILEKVLFQDLDSLINARNLLNENNIKAFVNCPLRAYPFFKELKNKYFSSGESIKLSYSGGDWVGLGCNLIHYLDLMNFLSSEKLIEIDISKLDPGYIKSKREGYVEFTGKVVATFSSGSELHAESLKNSVIDSTIEICSGSIRVVIDELTGEYKVYENDAICEESKYEVIYQSNLTHLTLRQMDKHGKCDLISFEESAELHTILISQLLSHYNKYTDEQTNILPIT